MRSSAASTTLPSPPSGRPSTTRAWIARGITRAQEVAASRPVGAPPHPLQAHCMQGPTPPGPRGRWVSYCGAGGWATLRDGAAGAAVQVEQWGTGDAHGGTGRCTRRGREVRCTNDARCTMYDVRCTRYEARCTMYGARGTMYDVLCTMHAAAPRATAAAGRAACVAHRPRPAVRRRCRPPPPPAGGG